MTGRAFTSAKVKDVVISERGILVFQTNLYSTEEVFKPRSAPKFYFFLLIIILFNYKIEDNL